LTGLVASPGAAAGVVGPEALDDPEAAAPVEPEAAAPVDPEAAAPIDPVDPVDPVEPVPLPDPEVAARCPLAVAPAPADCPFPAVWDPPPLEATTATTAAASTTSARAAASPRRERVRRLPVGIGG
jgi:hypothetical protein